MSKKNYLCVARSESGNCDSGSPEEMEQMMSAFNAWKQKFAENLIDLGGKLHPEGITVTARGEKDGPFVESKEIVGGYMILSASSLKEAAAIAKEIPGIQSPTSSIEIREIQTF